MGSFENKYVEAVGCHYSRIIASWRNSSIGISEGFSPRFEKLGKGHYKLLPSWFETWLKTLPLTEEEVRDIIEMADCGKFELEQNAEKFALAHKDEI